MRDVGDVHPQLPLTIANRLETNGIIEILRVIRINCDDQMGAAIDASLQFLAL